MKRRGQQPMSSEQQRRQNEINQIQAIANRINKLSRKFQSDLDPIQDRIDALSELELLTRTYTNEIVEERDTLRIELRSERETIKSLREELDELKKQLDPNIEAKPEPEKKPDLPKKEPEKPKKD